MTQTKQSEEGLHLARDFDWQHAYLQDTPIMTVSFVDDQGEDRTLALDLEAFEEFMVGATDYLESLKERSE